MPTCNNCSAKVARTDAFCGSCGEPVPGAKPVVPIAARPSQPSAIIGAPERVTGTFPHQPSSGGAAQAAAVVALSDPAEGEPPDTGLQEVNQTAIREREQSEPAPVLPLQRRKDTSQSEEELRAAADPQPTEPEPDPGASTIAERDTSLANVPVPAAPPILASDLLRQQMRPATPGAGTLRVVGVVLSALGALGALLAGGLHPLTFVSVVLLVLMATCTLTPLSYRARAISLTLIGLAATGVSLWQQTIHGMPVEGFVLAGAVILLSGALLFRAYYRGARLSRVLVAVGVTALGGWFVASGGHESLVMLEGHWQSWAPAATHMTFGLLALLSLMAFMDSSTRGGAHVWAVALLVLYVIHIDLMIASQLWPMPGREASIEGPTIAALIAGTVGTIIAGLALAQVFVGVYQSASSRPKPAA
jgi:hypothetical protein